MINKAVLPAVLDYQAELANLIKTKKEIGIDTAFEQKILSKMSSLTACLYNKSQTLNEALLKVKDQSDALELANYYNSEIFSDMQALRAVSDELETMMPSEKWPYPSYAELLFSVI